MTQKFGGKYRITSARAKWWNYANDGEYFVTICTKNREHFFGEISARLSAYRQGEMVLNKIGKMAQKFWMEIPNHFPFAFLDEFVVMPNHMHGIITIQKNANVNANANEETLHATSLPDNNPYSKISPKKYSLSSIIRSYKSVVTKNAKKINPQFAWQPRFHDHIIRNEKSLHNIRNYIQQNSAMWHRDRNKSNGIWM